MAEKGGTFKPGDDARRHPGGNSPGKNSGRPSNRERQAWGRILNKPEVQAAIIEVLSKPKEFIDIWNRTLEHASNRAYGPIPTVTATVDGAAPGGLGPSYTGPAVALMQMSPAPEPPAQE